MVQIHLDSFWKSKDLKTSLNVLDEGRPASSRRCQFYPIRRGQALGLVGESGCGKSMTVQSIMRITPKFAKVSGHIWHYPEHGEPVDLARLEPQGAEIRSIRGW